MPVATIAIQSLDGVLPAPPSKMARERAGLSIDAAAQKARISTAYLRSIEKHGGASFGLAQRLANVYGCRIDLFLTTATKGKARR